MATFDTACLVKCIPKCMAPNAIILVFIYVWHLNSFGFFFFLLSCSFGWRYREVLFPPIFTEIQYQSNRFQLHSSLFLTHHSKLLPSASIPASNPLIMFANCALQKALLESPRHPHYRYYCILYIFIFAQISGTRAFEFAWKAIFGQIELIRVCVEMCTVAACTWARRVCVRCTCAQCAPIAVLQPLEEVY